MRPSKAMRHHGRRPRHLVLRRAAPSPVPKVPVSSTNPGFPGGGGADDSMFCGADGVVYEKKQKNDMNSNNNNKEEKGKYHIHTFGCQMNMADSERWLGCWKKWDTRTPLTQTTRTCWCTTHVAFGRRQRSRCTPRWGSRPRGSR